MGRIKDLTGQKFGRLTALRDSGKRSSARHVIWTCQCDCGNICEADGVDLQRGKHQSCGCLAAEKRRENLGKYHKINNAPHRIDYTGYRSGKIVAVEPTQKRTSGGNVIWNCKCDCGNFCEVSTSDLKTKNIQSCGCLKSRSIGEFQISQLLTINGIKYKKQYKFADCLSPKGANLFFDFGVFDNQGCLRYLIEFDGDQHIRPIEFFGGEETFTKIKELDTIKNNYCKEHNIPLLRIPYSKRDCLTIDDLIPLKDGEPNEPV